MLCIIKINHYIQSDKEIHSTGGTAMRVKTWCFDIIIISLLLFLATGGDAGAYTKQYTFRVPSRGKIYYSVTIPQNAERLIVGISKQTSFVNLAIYPPGKNKPSSTNTAWSSRSYKDPFSCSASKPKPGAWRIEVEGSVHISNVDRIKYVTGLLTINVKGGKVQTTEQDTGSSPGGGQTDQGGQSPYTQTGPSDPMGVPEAGTWMGSATEVRYNSRVQAHIDKGDYDMFKFYFPGGVINGNVSLTIIRDNSNN